MKSFSRRHILKISTVVFAAIAMTAFGGDKIKFEEVGEYRAKGEAKEVKASRDVRYVKIESISGRVIINTIVIREGGKKTPVKVVSTIPEGKSHTVDFGKIYNITGLRISDDAGGKYKVYLGK